LHAFLLLRFGGWLFKKFSNDEHINYKTYSGIKLTGSGDGYEKKMVSHNRTWKVYLHRVVGLKRDEFFDEMHNPEYSTSEKLFNFIEEIPDFTEFDPYDGSIPSKDSSMPKQKKNMSLSFPKEGQTGKVKDVNDFDNSFLQSISKIGIKLNKDITVKNVLDFYGSTSVSVEKNQY
jgi:Mn-dependent DtxR family transcriptional regulator